MLAGDIDYKLLHVSGLYVSRRYRLQIISVFIYLLFVRSMQNHKLFYIFLFITLTTTCFDHHPTVKVRTEVTTSPLQLNPKLTILLLYL
jgi:hypothetical protein